MNLTLLEQYHADTMPSPQPYASHEIQQQSRMLRAQISAAGALMQEAVRKLAALQRQCDHRINAENTCADCGIRITPAEEPCPLL